MSDIQKTVLVTVQGRADLAAIEQAKAKIDAVKESAKQANSELSKDTSDKSLGRDDSGKNGFEKLLAGRGKAASGGGIAESAAKDATALEGLATKAGVAGAALGTLLGLGKGILANNRELRASWDRATEALSGFIDGALSGTAGAFPELTKWLDRMAVAMGGNTTQANATAQAMKGLTGSTTEGAEALKKQAAELDALAEKYKIAGDELKRFQDMEKTLDKSDGKASKRELDDIGDSIDAMPEGHDKEQAKLGLEGARKAEEKLRRDEERLRKVDDADRAASAAQSHADELAAKEEQASEAEGLAIKRAAARDQKKQAESKLKDLQNQPTAKLDLAAIAGAEKQRATAAAAASEAEEAASAAGVKGTPEDQHKQLVAARAAAKKSKATAAESKANADATADRAEVEGDDDQLDYEREDARRAGHSRALKDKAGSNPAKAAGLAKVQKEPAAKPSEREPMDVDEYEEKQRQLREHRQAAAAAHTNLAESVGDLSRAHSRNVNALAGGIKQSAEQASRAAEQSDRELERQKRIDAVGRSGRMFNYNTNP